MSLPAAEVIFLELSGVDPADRGAFLDARCGSDPALRRDVEALMSALEIPDSDFLDPGQIPTLDMAAVDAVRKWLFEPARMGKQPIAVWVLLPVKFELH